MLILLRRSYQVSSFSSDTSVVLGSVVCRGTVVSADGMWLLTSTPSAEELGCGLAGECGKVSLIVSNPTSASAHRSLQTIGLPLSDSRPRGATLSCPPFCPGIVATGLVVPLARSSGTVINASATYSYGPATISATGVILTLEDVLSTTSTGIYYPTKCSDSGIFTDPVSGMCTNVSNPLSLKCAFGSADSCTVCSPGALCPGGSRAWARPGFFSSSELIQHPVACAPPDPVRRCLRWNHLSGSTECGPTYRRGSYLCDSCAERSYADGDGSCIACPIAATLWDRFGDLILLILAVIVLGAFIYVMLRLFVRFKGKGRRSILAEAGYIATFITWLLTTVQILSQVSRVSSSSLPSFIRAIYRVVSRMQLVGVVLPPSCTGVYPFYTEVGIIGAGLCCAVLAVAMYHVRYGPPRRFIGAFAMSGALILMPMATSHALNMLNCRYAQLTQTAIAALNGGEAYRAISSANARATTSVPLLVSDSYFVCFAGSHRPAAKQP